MKYGVVLAAGLGTRMGSLTNYTPKALLPNSNDCLLKRQISFLRKHVQNVIVTYGYLGEQIVALKQEFDIDILIDTNNHGNAYFLQKLIDFGYSGIIPVITCDNLMTVSLTDIYEEAAKVPPGITIVPTEADYLESGDRIIHDNSLVKEIGPKTNSRILASGLQFIELDFMKKIRFETFSEIWQQAILMKRLRISSIQPQAWSAFDTAPSLAKFGDINVF